MASTAYRLVTVKELSLFLLNHKVINKLNGDLKFIESILEEVPKAQLLSVENETERYLQWCKECEFVKVTEIRIPKGIFQNSDACALFDIKVQPKTWGPDDPIYIAHEDIRRKVARGNCIFECPDASMPLDLVIRGFKKFTGGPGDDDDYTSPNATIWEKFFLKPLHEAESFVELSKANGDATHFSARWTCNDGFLFFAGSKNVHLAFKTKDDVDKYEEKRFNVARTIAHAILQLLEQIGQSQAERFLSFLHYTRMTCNAEILQPKYMHVENLGKMSKNEMQFIAWMLCDLTEDGTGSLCGLPPDLGIEVASAFGLTAVEYKVENVVMFEERMEQIRLGYHKEGSVLYFLDKQRSVIGIVKRKTTWYVIVRAIREKAKSLSRYQRQGQGKDYLADHIKKTEFRLLEIQKWIGLENDEICKWKKLGTHFMKWSNKELIYQRLDQKALESQFPVIWEKFLTNTKCNDKICI